MKNAIKNAAFPVGEAIYELSTKLFPICRSITGNGLRKSLAILQEYIPLKIFEVPTGIPVFDWKVPKEWNVKEAWIKNSKGEIIVNFEDHNLHLLNYSIPVKGTFSLEQLDKHLFSLPEQPDLIPYRTSYYAENWGFCLPHRLRQSLEEDTYEVLIDTTLEEGHLTYGELFIPGQSKEEILFSTHICHPSLANDNLSGIGVCTFLARALLTQKNHFSYRILFIPGTIGAITWLAQNEGILINIKAGLVASLLGDKGEFTYKKSRRGDTEIDRVATLVLQQRGWPHKVIDFSPYGYDERQFCSPGFNMAVGNLTRTPFGKYPEYHTSADNLDFIQIQSLEESFQLYLDITQVLEGNQTYVNQNPKCEPQLGRRGLYDAIGGKNDRQTAQLAILWILNLSDGNHSLLDIAERSGLPFAMIREMANLLLDTDLLQ
jgi:aminopeptidase-like protein